MISTHLLMPRRLYIYAEAASAYTGGVQTQPNNSESYHYDVTVVNPISIASLRSARIAGNPDFVTEEGSDDKIKKHPAHLLEYEPPT